jgi:predicted RNA-binding Zn-ribbon protein involved in translation (DUF1610 family)
MKKQPRFFCEHCGAEVRQNDKVCSMCGRFFSSVKCPACGYSGDSTVFRDGCPVCGYAFTPESKGHANPKQKKKEGIDPLPWWVYLVTLLLVTLLISYIIAAR